MMIAKGLGLQDIELFDSGQKGMHKQKLLVSSLGWSGLE